MYQVELTIAEKSAIETALNEQVGRALVRLAELARELGPDSPKLAELTETIVRTEKLVDKLVKHSTFKMMEAV